MENLIEIGLVHVSVDMMYTLFQSPFSLNEYLKLVYNYYKTPRLFNICGEVNTYHPEMAINHFLNYGLFLFLPVESDGRDWGKRKIIVLISLYVFSNFQNL